MKLFRQEITNEDIEIIAKSELFDKKIILLIIRLGIFTSVHLIEKYT